MRNPMRRERHPSRLHFYDLVAQLERERAFQDIPRLIVFVMHMQGRDGARRTRRRTWRQAGVRPLGDDELRPSGTNGLPSQWGDDYLVEALFPRAL